MAKYNDKECTYFRENLSDDTYELLKNEASDAMGMRIKFENVNENGEFVQLELICQIDQKVPKIHYIN